MNLRSRYLILIIFLTSTALLVTPPTRAQEDDNQTDRSALYPEDWQPRSPNAQSQFLHDFSYAGYDYGQSEFPSNPGEQFVDVTEAPYNADNTGETETSDSIQSAIDFVGQNGGGVVYLPAGTYRVHPEPGDAEEINTLPVQAALYISYDNVVLRGAGVDQTFIYNDSYEMRFKSVIALDQRPGLNLWYYEQENDVTRPVNNLTLPDLNIAVEDASQYEVNDWVIIRIEMTDALRAEHNMQDFWTDIPGLQYFRRVVEVDHEKNILTIDIPTRYPLQLRDDLRIHKASPQLQNVGVEHLSIGMKNHPNENADDQGDYDMHWSSAIFINKVVNGWVDDVHSYLPPDNDKPFHLLSNGIFLRDSRSVTITEVTMNDPQDVGDGGNGYLFRIDHAQEILVENSVAINGRHNYLIQGMLSSGNVIHNSLAVGGIGTEQHRHLSHANLFDNLTLADDSLMTFNRETYSFGAGFTGAQTVFWNTHQGDGFCKIVSDQFGWGYVIGTDPDCTVTVDTTTDATIDFTEFIGQGDLLEPQSLYIDQLEKRLSRSSQ